MQQKHSYLNSLRLSDAIWHWRSWSTLVKLLVMACCLMVSSHYLNQYWLITAEILEMVFTWLQFRWKCWRNVEDIYLPLICIWKLLIKITAAYSWWGWVDCFMLIGSLHMRFSGPLVVDYSLFIIQRYIGYGQVHTGVLTCCTKIKSRNIPHDAKYEVSSINQGGKSSENFLHEST